MKTMTTISCFKKLLLLASILLLGALAFIYSGIYPMGADSKHFPATYWVLETLREQSIARAAKDIVVPDNINASTRLLAGGADYNDMCASCHLKPEKISSDFSLGLYPVPPNLAIKHDDHAHSDDENTADKRRFWIIKHGIKASGMPSWAPGHDDERIWNMVSFIKRLPDLNAQQYQVLTARKKGDTGHH